MLMSRRALLSLTAGLASSWILRAQDPQRDSGGGFKVDIKLGNDRSDSVLAILREVGARDAHPEKRSGLGGVETVVAGILLAKGLANLVVQLLPMWKCGIVVDARQTPILTEKDCDLPRDTVLIMNPDGTRKRLPRPSARQIQDLAENFKWPN
jgi:hypothetical protein